MKLSQFITNVLTDIDLGVKNASDSTDRQYYINVGKKNSGVSFDVAVTTTTESNDEVEGKIKAGFVEVLGAGVSGKLSKKNGNVEVSRIQFNITVPSLTKSETAANIRKIQDNFNPHY